jgi:hypothetical protein
MVARIKISHPAFKHGGHSAVSVLPGENRAAFEKLHEDLIVEYDPSGPLEQHIVQELARLIWRRAHLSIFHAAKVARTPFVLDGREFSSWTAASPNLEELQAAECAARLRATEDQSRKQLGSMYELVVAGEIATIAYMERELKLMEHLDAMIDKCVKRLLHAKALKSVSVSPLLPRKALPEQAA